MVFIIFVCWRLIDFIIAYFALQIVPYLGYFAHYTYLSRFNLPRIITAFANFDGIYYLLIANRGYAQFEQAFFPLYPLIIRLLSHSFFGNELLIGLFISNLCLVAGLFIFKKYLIVMKQWNHMIVVFLLLFPTSFFFGAVYTESLFFLLVILTLYFLHQKKYLLAGAFGFLAGLTRINGILLTIPFAIEFIRNFKKNRNNWSSAILSITPLLGLLTYMRFLLKTVGDTLAFFHAQSVFGEARSTKIILLPQVFYRYFKILLTAKPNLQYFISFLEPMIFCFVFTILVLDLIKSWKLRIKNYSLISLNLFSFANLLISTITGSFMSIPRFALLSISFFIFLGRIKNIWIIRGLIILFIIFHIVLLSLFIQGYFVS